MIKKQLQFTVLKQNIYKNYKTIKTIKTTITANYFGVEMGSYHRIQQIWRRGKKSEPKVILFNRTQPQRNGIQKPGSIIVKTIVFLIKIAS